MSRLKQEQSALFSNDMPHLGNNAANTITITGSRSAERDLARGLFERILPQYTCKERLWLLGGAMGVDSWALEWLHERGEESWIVVPFTTNEQPIQARALFSYANKVVELRLAMIKAAYISRNKFMVDNSHLVIGFWDGQPGGTLSTINYAIKTYKETHVIPLHGDNENARL